MGTLKRDALTEAEEMLLAAFAGRDEVQAVVQATMSLVRDEYGSRTQYIQQDSKRKRRLKIVHAWKEQRRAGFEDRNAIAKEFDVSRSTVNRAIARYLRDQTRRVVDTVTW
jgi:hypothetical protein